MSRLNSSCHRSFLVLFLVFILMMFSSSLYAGEKGIWARVSTSFLSVDDYFKGGGPNFRNLGEDSLASFLYLDPSRNGSADIQSTTLEASYSFSDGIFSNGIYIYGALQWADIDSKGEPGSNLNYSESSDLRKITLGVGFDKIYDEVFIRIEARYEINEDDSFDNLVGIPITDGSDSLILNVSATKSYANFNHKVGLGYQNYSEADNRFPGKFELGDRFEINYEIGRYFYSNNLYVGISNNYYAHQETDGNYFHDKRRANEVTFKVDYNWTDLVGVDFSYSKVWEGSDAPKTDQFNIGVTLKA